MYTSFSLIFTIAALLSVINYKWLKLPNTIGQLILALGLSIILLLLKQVIPESYQYFNDIIQNADFPHIMLDIMLGFLLFAGALHVNIKDLQKERWSVLLFSTIGVMISTFLVGGGLYLLAKFFQCEMPFLHCLLFGALISPTDPIAVLAILEKAKVAKSLRLKIEGESLFNDGIGVIVFTGILLFINMESAQALEAGSMAGKIVAIFMEEVILGLGLGLALGFVGLQLMKSVQENAFLVTMLSLAIVFGGNSLANLLHTSAPLAMVVAGLYVGYGIRHEHFRQKTSRTLHRFWQVLDESLNGVLFVFLGLAIHLISIESRFFLLSAVTILLVIAARFVSVLLPYSLLKHREHSWLNTTYILTWGGLKGGISLALAFSIAPDISQNTLLFLTYTVVIFSILVQGLTIPKLAKKL